MCVPFLTAQGSYLGAPKESTKSKEACLIEQTLVNVPGSSLLTFYHPSLELVAPSKLRPLCPPPSLRPNLGSQHKVPGTERIFRRKCQQVAYLEGHGKHRQPGWTKPKP